MKPLSIECWTTSPFFRCYTLRVAVQHSLPLLYKMSLTTNLVCSFECLVVRCILPSLAKATRFAVLRDISHSCASLKCTVGVAVTDFSMASILSTSILTKSWILALREKEGSETGGMFECFSLIQYFSALFASAVTILRRLELGQHFPLIVCGITSNYLTIYACHTNRVRVIDYLCRLCSFAVPST